MYPQIVCISCGRSLGDLYDLYIALKRAKVIKYIRNEYAEMDPDNLMFTDITIETGDILDQLNLHMDCCRSHMIAQALHNEYY